METKSLLFGLIGFFMGGLLVSVTAASTPKEEYSQMSHSSQSLEQKVGDDFDSAYLRDMIAHHEGALEMSKLAETNAKHEELKKVARNIIRAQQSEINQFKEWQSSWNYTETTKSSH